MKRKFKIYLTELRKRSEGQIVLMFVLITVVGLTIGLSLISRTISDIRISSQIEQSSRAFTAAEAGVENALKGSLLVLPTGSVTLPGASAQYSVKAIGGDVTPLTFPFTQPSEVQTAWLIDHDTDGLIKETGGYSYPADKTITICFGSVPGTTPAISISLLYYSGSTFKLAKASYDSVNRPDGFILADTATSICPTGYLFMKTLTPTLESDLGIDSVSILYAMRIIVIYEGTNISIVPQPSNPFPVQGKIITSVGQTDTGIVRRVQVSQGFTVLPSLLDFALFSEN